MAVKKQAKPVKKMAAAKSSAVKKTKAPVSGKKVTTAIDKPYTKTQILGEVAETIGITQKQVAGVLEHLQNLIERHIKKNGSGLFILPGLLKIQVINKPATKARKGINPFTGEATVFKAKPARNVVKIKPLKKLKEMV